VVLRTEPFDPRSADTLFVLQAWLKDALPDLARQHAEGSRRGRYGHHGQLEGPWRW